MNILIAFVLFWMVFGIFGVREQQPDAGRPVVAEVSRCVIPFADEGRACLPSDPPTPAYDAGLRPGDVITSFNGTAITGWEQLRSLIRGNEDGRAVIGYERDGRQLTGRTSTTVEARPTSQSDLTLKQVGFLGITPTSHTVTTTGGPLFTLQQMGDMTVQTVKALGTLPVKVWGVGKAIVGLQERDPNGPISIVGGGRIAGETAASHSFDVEEKLFGLIAMAAAFNLFIGAFNFVPLLPLDGGHIAGALWEALRRGFARLRRRPDPGFVDVAKLLPVAYVVATCLLVMGAVLIVGDLVVPLHVES
jgi:membrane-associated protease RseP (regulator of RpoE activity)